jgi:hypothetical protein
MAKQKDLMETMEEIKEKTIWNEPAKEPIMELIVEIEQSRYEELVAKETELRILKNALANMNNFDFNGIKRIFGI